MKHYFKLALLGFVASLNLHGSPLPQNTPVASDSSAEKVWEKVALEKERKREQEMLQENIREFNREFDRVLHNHDLPSLAWLIQMHPSLFANTISRQIIGSDLRIAQFIYDEMKKQRLPFTRAILTNWLQGAVRADAVDVFEWLITKFDFFIPMIGPWLNQLDRVPGGKVEAYLKRTGLLDSVKPARAIYKNEKLTEPSFDKTGHVLQPIREN